MIKFLSCFAFLMTLSSSAFSFDLLDSKVRTVQLELNDFLQAAEGVNGTGVSTQCEMEPTCVAIYTSNQTATAALLDLYPPQTTYKSVEIVVIEVGDFVAH